VNDYDDTTTPYIYTGPNAAFEFLKNILTIGETITQDIKTTDEPMIMTNEDKENFRNATCCHLCKQKFDSNHTNDIAKRKVADHDHFNGKYRGAAHSECNTQCRKDHFEIGVFFHNLRGYDGQHIMESISNFAKENDINLEAIPINHEKFISFKISSKNKIFCPLEKKYKQITTSIVFKDTFSFMPESLDNLTKNLKNKDENSFNHLRKYINKLGLSEEHYKTLLRKGVFPYDWFDDDDKLNYIGLPPIESFYSKKDDKHIKLEDYEYAKHVYELFNCKTFKDYMELYMVTDVLLLTDVFEAFIDMCLKYYELDPCHYFTSPGMFWDAMLLKTGAILELPKDVDIMLNFEESKRGGISMISNRYAKANNPYLSDYDKTKEDSYIIYVDANNLYGHSMSQPLPTGNFKFDKQIEKYTKDYIMSLNPNGNKGCLLKVDLKYPECLHDKHNDYPLAPEKMDIKYKDISDYNMIILQDLSKSELDGEAIESSKLVPNLNDKKDYVLDFRNLQFYMSQGMELIEVKEVITFDQDAFMKPYIDFNSEKRKESKNDFEKNFFKLANNSVYGKTMENIRNHMNLKHIFGNETDKFLKQVANPRFKNMTRFDEDMLVLEMRKLNLVFNKPLFVGTTVLELSKIHMYDFHYNHMMPKYGYEKCKLLFTDTDSLCYYIKTDDLYKDMLKDKELYDLSDYPKDHFLHDNTNKKIIGKFKDETNGTPIIEFIGLKPKMYAFITSDYDKRVAKGIVKNVIDKKLKFDTFKSVLDNSAFKNITQRTIRSIKHQLYTIQQTKIGLSPVDTKRYLLDDGINSYAYGHYKINS